MHIKSICKIISLPFPGYNFRFLNLLPCFQFDEAKSMSWIQLQSNKGSNWRNETGNLLAARGLMAVGFDWIAVCCWFNLNSAIEDIQFRNENSIQTAFNSKPPIKQFTALVYFPKFNTCLSTNGKYCYNNSKLIRQLFNSIQFN